MPPVPQFDYYVVSRVLGEGGMGIVYLAMDRRTDLPVAIKVMSKRMHDPEVQFRFMRENEILSQLNHRNIVRCYEITRARDGTPCIVMEYLKGSDFRAFEGRPYPELIPLMIQTLMGMEYLRQQKIVHRDLSSNNLLVILENEKRFVKILDFGIAKILHETPLDGEMNTQTGQFLGKFGFAAPELFFSTSADWRSDMYSLGVVFFRLLTRHAPIRVEKSGNFYEWMTAHQRPFEPSFDVPATCPPLPENLRDVLRLMLARDPDARPQNYRLVIDWLDAIQQQAFEQGLEPDPTEITRLPQPVDERGSSRPSDAVHPSGDRRATPSDSRLPSPMPSPRSGSAEQRLWTPGSVSPFPSARPAADQRVWTPGVTAGPPPPPPPRASSGGPPPLPSTPSPGPRRGGSGSVDRWQDLPTAPDAAYGARVGGVEDKTARLEDLVPNVSDARPPQPARPGPPEPVTPAPRAAPAPAPVRRVGGGGGGRNRFIDVNASMGMSSSGSRPLPAVSPPAPGLSRTQIVLIVAGVLLLMGGVLFGLLVLFKAATGARTRAGTAAGPPVTAYLADRLRFESPRPREGGGS